MRLNVEKKEVFTSGELHQVARDCETDVQQVISRVLEDRTGPITTEDIALAGTALRLEWTADVLIGALRANRRLKNPDPSDDTITIGELREALKRDDKYWRLTSIPIDVTVDKLVKSIRDHREPDWEAGDVVQDADGKFWKRTRGDKTYAWAGFQSLLYSSFSTPKRPLRKVGEEK